MSDAETVVFEKKGRVAIIKLNRPELNLVNGSVVTKLMECLEDTSNDSNIRCIVLAGAGRKAFSAGIDLKHVSSLSKEEQLRFAQSTHDLVYRLARFEKPTVAALHGHVIGMGFMLAMAADLRIVSQDTLFKIPEVELGMFPGSGITVLSLKSGCPHSQLLELILTCRQFGAVEADKLGLVNKMVKLEELDESALSLAKKVSFADPEVAAPIKTLIREYETLGFDEAQRKETELHFNYMKRRFAGN